MHLDVEMKHVEGCIGRERFQRIWGEIYPFIVKLLPVIAGLIIEPVPAGYNPQVYIRDSDSQNIHQNQEYKD